MTRLAMNVRGVRGSQQPQIRQVRQVAPPGSFTSWLRCASLKSLYKPEDAFNESDWV